MADEQVHIDVDVVDNASDKLHDLAGDVRHLDDADPTPTVTLEDADVQADIANLNRELGLLDDNVTTVRVDGDASGVDNALRGVSDNHHGKVVGAGFVSDLTGAMGDGASKVAGVFDNISAGVQTTLDTLGARVGGSAGDVLSKLGGAFTSALGIGGVAYVAIDQLYTWWQHRNDDQKKAIEDTWKALKDAAGDTSAVLEKDVGGALEKLNDKQRNALVGAGINMADLIALIHGEAVPAMDDLAKAHEQYGALAATVQQNLALHQWEAANAAIAAQNQLQGQEDAYNTINGLIHDQGGAIQGAIDKYNDLATIMGKPLIPTLNTSVIDRQLADLATRALNVGGLFHFNVSPSNVASASALDTRRQGPR